ncbi:rhamnulokinase [Celerinatantimonas yamalensis]|uniref:Rhamnulokinase n=1 Tax=Celerinatantimonas yamalensis TaxID=559956 RepID=A0ABW9G5S8_9GAMM
MYQVVAVDLGATSARVMLAQFDPLNQSLKLQQIHRFANHLVKRHGQLCWDIEHLENEIFTTLKALVVKGKQIDAIGVDSWGVDFICLDKLGHRLGEAVSYRDARTHQSSREFCEQLGFEKLYQQTGIQFQPFNTLFQLKALSQESTEWFDQIDKVLMLPDYFHYRLTGQYHWDYTNASTTGMLNCHSGQWLDELVRAAGANPNWFATTELPGTVIGRWDVDDEHSIAVISPPTHDTAAAIAAAPLMNDSTAYISSGTWSLIGIESPEPLTSSIAQLANLTNEGGANRQFRVLKNVMGMWLIEGILVHWPALDICQLCQQSSEEKGFVSLIDPNDPCFINPHSMVEAIEDYCVSHGQPVPQSASALARCVFDSLALSYRDSLQQLEQASGRRFNAIRIVGGGSQNHLLNQLCADVCQLPVTSGPVEASALGNIGYQLIGLGAIKDAQTLRHIIANSFAEKSFFPRLTPKLNSAITRFHQLSQVSPNNLQSQMKEYV